MKGSRDPDRGASRGDVPKPRAFACKTAVPKRKADARKKEDIPSSALEMIAASLEGISRRQESAELSNQTLASHLSNLTDRLGQLEQAAGVLPPPPAPPTETPPVHLPAQDPLSDTTESEDLSDMETPQWDPTA